MNTPKKSIDKRTAQKLNLIRAAKMLGIPVIELAKELNKKLKQRKK